MRFVLVHGGSHGAWCWDLLIPEIEKYGHTAVAVDLPGHGQRSDEISTIDGYRYGVAEVLRPGDVLVGHSLGCSFATLGADSFTDIAHIVFLAGALPVEGRPMLWEGGASSDGDDAQVLANEDVPDFAVRLSDDGQYSFFSTLEGATACFYHDCSPEQAAWAFEQLTPQRMDVMVAFPLSVPNFWAANIPRSFIRCREDRAFPNEYSNRTIQRLGVNELTIGTSHSPFLSRPAELASLILTAIETQPIGPLDPYGEGVIDFAS